MPARAEIALRDDAGHAVRLPRTAQRIVTLAPHATELLFAVGAGGRIVGTVEFSDYPEAALRIPRVGGYQSLDVERILALKPDLVVAWGSGNQAGVIDQLRKLGVPVFDSEPHRLADVEGALRNMGTLAGTEQSANAAADAFAARAAALRTRYANRPPVRVFYQVWAQPLMTVNDTHLISDVLHLCGGENVFGKLPALVPTVDVEAVIGANPLVIMASEEAGAGPGPLKHWQRWPRIAAVKQGNLVMLPSAILVRHAPRILDAAQLVCEHLDRVRAAR